MKIIKKTILIIKISLITIFEMFFANKENRKWINKEWDNVNKKWQDLDNN
jgi:hypothetical protein